MISLKDRVKAFFLQHRHFLQDNYPGLTEPRLWEEVKNLDEYLIYSDSELNDSSFFNAEIVPLNLFFNKVLEGIPLAYISGKHYFYKSEFIINKNVLIPRPETEILVEKTVQIIKKNNKIVDVGTGSGAIILSVLMELDFPVQAWAVDISQSALDVAINNYALLKHKIHPLTKIHFINSDRLYALDSNFDVIVSNPPYIKYEVGHKDVHHQVIKFEPKVALFLKDQEYENWFSVFFQQCEKSLVSSGRLLLEGNEKHLVDLKKILIKQQFYDILIHQDYTGRERFMTATKR